MTCESCGTEIDALGDDALDATEVCDEDDEYVMETKALKVKCPMCGHIQYGSRANIDEWD